VKVAIDDGNPKIGGRRVELSDPDPDWPAAFERERGAIEAALGSLGALRVEHIGSTAIQGIRAKPILDIMVGVQSFDFFDESRVRLETLGYDYDVNALLDDADRHVFRKGPAGPGRLRTHHLHYTVLGGKYWVRILAFREHLRVRPEVAREYEWLKIDLASKYADDGRRYTRGKGAFVRRIQDFAMKELPDKHSTAAF
jgi:GrpB-like predicted nucleotidyltransferase (UPF0157 family)